MANTIGPQIWTPGSDYTLGSASSQILLTRDGNDNILTYDPGTDNDGQLKLDVLAGDLEVLDLLSRNIDVSFLREADNESSRDWQNRFILGDWRQPYYIDPQTSGRGFNQFATIFDLNPNLDLIQLHGDRENYFLEERSLGDRGTGTAIFWQEGINSDLVAFLPSVMDLSLDDELFRFEENIPPPVSFPAAVEQTGTIGIDLFTGSATDSIGNVYVAGATTGAIEGNNAGAYDPIVTKYDSNGSLIWNLQFGSDNFDWITDIVTDETGNFYVAGYTEGDLGASKEAEVSDVWLAKYNEDGNRIWLEQFGSDRTNRTFGIEVDSDGQVYLSGYTVEEGRRSQTDDSWVTKYDSDGNQQWFSEFGTRQFDEAYDVTVDEAGNVYSTGWTLGNLGGNNAGVYDVWLAKHDNDGKLQFIEQFGTEEYEFPWGIDTDSQGNVYLTGWTLGDLGGANAGSYDVWLAKYTPDGDREWIQQFGTSGDDSLLFGDLEVDFNDDVFLTGYTDGGLGGANAGAYDAWVTKYNNNGDRQWIQQLGTPDLDYSYDLSSDSAGHLYVTGITEGSLGEANNGATDSWIAQLDTELGTIQNFEGSPRVVL